MPVVSPITTSLYSLIALPLLGVWACNPASTSSAYTPPPSANSANSVSSIELTPSLLDLGELPPGGRAVGEITIHNCGTSPIRVARFESTCPCVRVSPSALDLKADETREITVAFDAAEEPEFHGGLRVSIQGRGATEDLLLYTTVEAKVRGEAYPNKKETTP